LQEGTRVQGRAPSAAASKGQWLYPILEGRGRQFEGQGRKFGAEFAAYRRAVVAGRISRGEGPLEAGFRSIREGDVLWLYAGDAFGVVGRGTVRNVTGRPRPRVSFTLDKAACRLLAQDPLPGNLARRSTSGSVQAPISLVELPDLLEGLEWWIEHLDDRDERRLRMLGVPSLRQSMARHPSLLQDAGLGALTRTLRALDLALGVVTEPAGARYVVGLDNRVLVVGGLVGGGQASVPTPAVLKAVGTFAWCGWSLKQRAHDFEGEVHNWFVFKRAPNAELLRFLEDAGHSVSWVQGGQIDLGPRTRLRWPLPQRAAARSLRQNSTAGAPIPPTTTPRRGSYLAPPAGTS